MKLVLILVAVIAVLGWLAVGLLVAQGPQPEIVVPAEIITKVGPINISNTMITAWTVMILLIVLSFFATRSMKLMPSGFQNFAESLVGFLVGQCEEIAGEKNGRKFFSVVATIFLFIIFSNWFGLMPFFNAIGKTEDVGHEVFVAIEEYSAGNHLVGCSGTIADPAAPGALANCQSLDFAAWKMDKSGGIVFVKPRAKNVDFAIPAGQEPGVAMDRYIVFLANEFVDGFAAAHPAPAGGAEGGEGAPPAALVQAALDALNSGSNTPKILSAAEGEGAGAAAGVPSAALGQLTVTGVSFQDSQKLALVVPFFRSTFSDVNNTLAMGIIAFIVIEFWGFQALGFGYLKKFFNLNGINSFVGILELLSEFIRVISFAFRLFGNIFAGEVLILMLTFLMPFLFVDIIYGLELFVGFIQASVFALLVLVFATMATEHHGDDDHHDGHDDDGAADPHHQPGEIRAH